MNNKRPTWNNYFKDIVITTSHDLVVIDYTLVVFLLKIIELYLKDIMDFYQDIHITL